MEVHFTFLLLISCPAHAAWIVGSLLGTAEAFLSASGSRATRREMGEFARKARPGELLIRVVALEVPAEHARARADGFERAGALEKVLRQTARSAGAKEVEVQVLVEACDRSAQASDLLEKADE